MNSETNPNQMTVSLILTIKFKNVIHPFTKGIWYRAIVRKKVIKAQCDEDGKPTGNFLLTPSRDEGYIWDLPSFMDATKELAARKDRMRGGLPGWSFDPPPPEWNAEE